MASFEGLEAERQRRLEQVIAAFLKAVDDGRDADPMAWLARHPDLHPELVEFFEDEEEFLRLIGPRQPLEGPLAASGEDGPDPIWDDPFGFRSGLSVTGPGPGRAGDRLTGELPTNLEGVPTLVIESARIPREAGQDQATPSGTAVRYFGDYELGRVLGRGGMGIVYAGRQISLNRPVALKMIRAGRLSTEDDRRRFQNEAETVATLDHPNIVPIHEVGRHRNLSFFSMKLIAGGNLLELVARARPEPEAAARLAVTIAEAIHHAHQRGVLHRDLKPANILIDEHGRPHVTDFGLARRLADEGGLTRSDAILGTPAFMAPEQASGKRAAVTVATDVYGIGGILYVLLSGQAPFQGVTALDTLDLVRHQPPIPPSKLNRRVPRDLEIICLKCLSKDPNHRYGSARELADDLMRWLEGKPILARPARAGTRLILWCRRKPALAGLQLTIVVGSLAIAWNWHRAEEHRAAAVASRDLANQRLIAVEKSRNEAKAEADKSFWVLSFLVNELLPQAEPGHNPRGHKITVEEALDRAAEKLDASRSGIPAVIEESIRCSLADTYHGLGQYAKSERQWRRALEVANGSDGPDHPDTINVKGDLAHVLAHLGRLAEAEVLSREVLETHRRSLGAEHAQTLLAMGRLVYVLNQLNSLDEAESLARQWLDTSRRTLGPEHAQTRGAMRVLATVLLRRGNPEEAELLARQNLEAVRRNQGRDAPETLSAMHALAGAIRSRGRLGEAEILLREALTLSRLRRGDDHDATLEMMRELVRILGDHRQFPEAESLAREALEISRRVRGRDDPETLTTTDALAAILRDQRKLGEAEQLLRDTLAGASTARVEDRSRIAELKFQLGAVLNDAGRFLDAEPVLRDSLGIRHSSEPLAWCIQLQLGRCLAEQRRYEEAEPFLLQAEAKIATSHGERQWTSQIRRQAREYIEALYKKWGRPADAARWRVEALDGAPRPRTNP